MEGLEWNIDTVASVIDIAVAPVFLLAGISGLLMVLTNRLGRTIDHLEMRRDKLERSDNVKGIEVAKFIEAINETAGV